MCTSCLFLLGHREALPALHENSMSPALFPVPSPYGAVGKYVGQIDLPKRAFLSKPLPAQAVSLSQVAPTICCTLATDDLALDVSLQKTL